MATRYNNASNNKDVVILIAAMADDCVVEKSLPRLVEPGFKAKMSSGLSGVKSSSLRQLSIDTEGQSTKQRPAPCQIGLQMGRAEPEGDHWRAAGGDEALRPPDDRRVEPNDFVTPHMGFPPPLFEWVCTSGLQKHAQAGRVERVAAADA